MLREGDSIFGRTSDGVASPIVYAPPPVRPMVGLTRVLQGGDGAPAVPPYVDPALWNLAGMGALGSPQGLGGCGTCGQIRKVGGAAGTDGLGLLAEAGAAVGFVSGAFFGGVGGALVGAIVGYLRTPHRVGHDALWGAGIGALALGTIYAVGAGSVGAQVDKDMSKLPVRTQLPDVNCPPGKVC